MWGWETYQGERSEGGRESVQLGEGELVVVLSDETQEQVLGVTKGANPANDIRVYERGRTRFEKGDGTCVASKGAGRIWKGLFPQFDGARWEAESDVREKEPSSPGNL